MDYKQAFKKFIPEIVTRPELLSKYATEIENRYLSGPTDAVDAIFDAVYDTVPREDLIDVSDYPCYPYDAGCGVRMVDVAYCSEADISQDTPPAERMKTGVLIETGRSGLMIIAGATVEDLQDYDFELMTEFLNDDRIDMSHLAHYYDLLDPDDYLVSDTEIIDDLKAFQSRFLAAKRRELHTKGPCAVPGWVPDLKED